MSKRARLILIIGVLAVVAYFGYRWWQGRQSNTGQATTPEGTNLNSIAPELVAGSSGPDSGLDYQQGTEVVNLTLPGSNTQNVPAPSPTPVTVNPRTIFPMRPVQP